jgi:hypothetical protein
MVKICLPEDEVHKFATQLDLLNLDAKLLSGFKCCRIATGVANEHRIFEDHTQ